MNQEKISEEKEFINNFFKTQETPPEMFLPPAFNKVISKETAGKRKIEVIEPQDFLRPLETQRTTPNAKFNNRKYFEEKFDFSSFQKEFTPRKKQSTFMNSSGQMSTYGLRVSNPPFPNSAYEREFRAYNPPVTNPTFGREFQGYNPHVPNPNYSLRVYNPPVPNSTFGSEFQGYNPHVPNQIQGPRVYNTPVPNSTFGSEFQGYNPNIPNQIQGTRVYNTPVPNSTFGREFQGYNPNIPNFTYWPRVCNPNIPNSTFEREFQIANQRVAPNYENQSSSLSFEQPLKKIVKNKICNNIYVKKRNYTPYFYHMIQMGIFGYKGSFVNNTPPSVFSLELISLMNRPITILELSAIRNDTIHNISVQICKMLEFGINLNLPNLGYTDFINNYLMEILRKNWDKNFNEKYFAFDFMSKNRNELKKLGIHVAHIKFAISIYQRKYEI